MGMYTAFHFASELKEDTPNEVIEILRFMDGQIECPKQLPNHPFFNCYRWDVLFSADSYYFDAKTHHSVFFDEISDSWYITVTSNLKNYNNEISLFLDWIYPYLNKNEGDFLGYSIHEEEESPTIIKYSLPIN